MAQVASYPEPARPLLSGDKVLGAADLSTNSITLDMFAAYMSSALFANSLDGDETDKSPTVAAVAAAIVSILTGAEPLTLTDEATGQSVTGRLILSGGVLKFAPVS